MTGLDLCLRDLHRVLTTGLDVSSFGCGSKISTANGTLVSGNMDQNPRSNSWWFNLTPTHFRRTDTSGGQGSQALSFVWPQRQLLRSQSARDSSKTSLAASYVVWPMFDRRTQLGIRRHIRSQRCALVSEVLVSFYFTRTTQHRGSMHQ